MSSDTAEIAAYPVQVKMVIQVGLKRKTKETDSDICKVQESLLQTLQLPLVSSLAGLLALLLSNYREPKKGYLKRCSAVEWSRRDEAE